MNERLKQLADSAAKYSAVMAMKSDESANELFVEHLVQSVVQECIQQLEIGKKCDRYTGELFTCDHNDNIDYQIEVLKDHFGLELPEKLQTHVHAVNTSSERVNKTEKSEHEFECPRCGHCCREWVGLTYEETLGIAFNFDVPSIVVWTVENKLKEKNT